MAKFYIESGELQLVIEAHNARGAALWAVHRTMATVLPFVGDEDADGLAAPVALQRPVRLGETIATHERGFGRPDAAQFDTLEVLTQWNQLLGAIDRLQQGIAATGKA